MGNYRVGVGVCTYNRPDRALSLVKAIRDTTDNVNLICSIDGGDFLKYDLENINSLCDNLLIGKNDGVVVNKNRLLVYLQDCDFIFLIEDDLLPIKKGWIDKYLEVIEKTGYQHLNYIHGLARSCKIKEDRISNDITLEYFNDLGGGLMIITKDCLQRVGLFDPRYKYYGYGHCDYTRRCRMAGLYPSDGNGNPHIKDIDNYLYMDPTIPSSMSISDRDKYRAENSKRYGSGSPRVYIPKEEFRITYRNLDTRCG